MHTRAALVVATAALALVVAVSAQREAPPDLIVHGARVHTANAAAPHAEAVAIRGSRFMYVGPDAGALALAGPDTRVIDASGATVLPGLHDAHAHFTGLGASLQMLDLRDTASYDEVVALVGERAKAARPGEWILGRSWDQNRWPVKEWPTREPLDRAAPRNPVYLTRVDGHAALVNTAALELGNVGPATPDPDGGRIIRNGGGGPVGVLVDRAMGLVAAKIPPVSDAQLEEQILLADAETRRLGLTMVHDAGADERTVAAYRRLSEAGRLQTRLYVMLRMPLARLEPFFAGGPDTGGGDHRVVVRAIKISIDGALGSRGAAMLEPYSDEPGTRGLLVTSPDDALAMTRAASKAGFQTCIHAIGDRANRLVLDIFEQVQREIPGARDLRLRNEHAQILHPDDIPRFARLGVIASMQGTHATSDMPWVPARIGEARARQGAYVWRALLATGATIANGSDFPVEKPDPLLGFHASITRQDAEGRPPGGWMPEQRMTREETLASFTRDAAFAAHAERDLGSIEVGKLADLTMLSHDVMTIPPADILKTRVLRTVVGGRVVFEQ
jgi:predicted amidohydrolase YtcJ